MECIVVVRAKVTKRDICERFPSCRYDLFCAGGDVECEHFIRDKVDRELRREDGFIDFISDEKLAKYTIPYEPLEPDAEMELFRKCLKEVVRAISLINRDIIRFMSE